MRRLVLLGVAVGACVSQARPSAEGPADRVVRWRGAVRFQARTPTPTGASRTMEWRPAAHVRVDALDGEGAVVGHTRTDEAGRFELEASPRARELRVVAHLRHAGWDLAVTRDAAGEVDHHYHVLLGDPTQAVDVAVPDTHEASGAFHILASLWRGAQAVQQWTGRPLPPFFAYWARGVTTNWSFYVGDRGTGRYAIELLGGEAERRTVTDTDEHDEMIVLHEFGHFVMDVLSSDSSDGGQHPRGFLLVPGLAWEEARATWFAAAVSRSPLYQDTIGLEPAGRLRLSHDLERGDRTEVRGLGSESGAAEILWDLADGADGLADQDADGVALGPAQLLAAMAELGQQPGAHPAISTFLRFLVSTGRVRADQVKRILVLGGHPTTLLPQDDEHVWPPTLALPATVAGKIDGLSDPAPSGGPPRPLNGQDAVAVYRFEIVDPAWVSATLEIFGTGSAEDRSDLDLELRDIRAELLDSSRGESGREIVSQPLQPGWYVVYVRDGGEGNRAGYELRIEARQVRGGSHRPPPTAEPRVEGR